MSESEDGAAPDGFASKLRRRLSSVTSNAAAAHVLDGDANGAESECAPTVESEEESEDKTAAAAAAGRAAARKSKVEDAEKEKAERKQLAKLYRAAAPAHWSEKESPLSSTSIFQQSHAGLFNLCIVVLVATNFRLIIENLMKYGLLIRAGFWFNSETFRDWPLLICCLSLLIFPLCAFVIEKLAQKKTISNQHVTILHVILTTAVLVYPVTVILSCDCSVLSGVILMFVSCIFWLKLVSYAHTNYDIREVSKTIDKDDVHFKSDILQGPTLKSLAYFMLAPTLCYQPRYPRTPSIRKNWLFRQIIQFLIFTGLMGFIIEQYINPIVKHSQHPLKGDLLNAIVTILRLSIPNIYVWLCMFYTFFHLWLNIVAELLRFGDREFYKDWWNAKTVDEYWRKWNMPVHQWMVRHVYIPCVRKGVPKEVSFLVSFFVSAIFHELCIAVPCHIFTFWAFLGIMLQIPLVILTNVLQNKFGSTTVGNMIFWLFFCVLGQPMCVLLYYHDVMNRKNAAS